MTGFLYAATVFIWGTTWLAIAFQVGEVPVTTSIMYRFALAAIVLVVFLVVLGKLQRLTLKQHGSCLLLGLCLFSCNFIFMYNSARYIPSGLISIVFSMATVLNMFNGWLFFKKRPSQRLVMGAVTGIVGIVLLFWPDLQNSAKAGDTVLGLLLALGGTYCFSLGNMQSIRLQAQGLTVLSANGYGMGYGALLLLILGLASGQSLALSTAPVYLGSLIYLALIGSVLGFSFYLILVGRLGAQKAAYTTVMFPLVALGLSTIFEGYVWTPLAFMGLAVVMAGNLLVFGNPLPLLLKSFRLKSASIAESTTEIIKGNAQ
jgi:drug/metabolite transporter (DMT)-like permease